MVDHKHHILGDPGQIGWCEEVHKVAIDNLEKEKGSNIAQINHNESLPTSDC